MIPRITPKKAYVVAGVALVVGPILLPGAALFYMAPPLLMSIYTTSRTRLAVHALGAGILVDSLHYTPFGLSALCYFLTTQILYNQRRHFFEESLATLPVMTYFFSALATLLTWSFAHFMGALLPFSWKGMCTDIIVFPCMDALYALSVFTLPAYLLRYFKKRLLARGP